jgi:cell division septum initiation protein DivIVA
MGVMSEPTQDLLPLYEASRGFDTAMRGYDRAQVDREINRLDDDVRVTAAERDAAAARSADLAAQLASAQAQGESLRRQLRAATEAVTTDNVDEHVKQILQAAKADAAKLRTEAQTEAEQVRNGAADSAARTRSAAHAEAERIVAEATVRQAQADETFRVRLAEAETRRDEIEQALAESEARTRAEEDRLSAEAQAERTRLDAEALAERTRLDAEALAERTRLDADSLAKRVRAEEDFEITLRLRRTAATAEQAQQKATADAAAAKTLADAREKAEQMVANATHEVRRLHGVRNEVHAQLESLHTTLRSSLDESLAATPDEPDRPSSGSPPE